MLRRFQRISNTAALDWSWFFEQVDRLAESYDVLEEGSIKNGTLLRTNFEPGTFLRAEAAYSGSESIVLPVQLRDDGDRAKTPSPVHARFLSVKLTCTKYTIATVSYCTRLDFVDVATQHLMAYCLCSVGTRMLTPLTSISQPLARQLDVAGVTEYWHNRVFSGFGTIELFEGDNYVNIAILYGYDEVNGEEELATEISIAEIR